MMSDQWQAPPDIGMADDQNSLLPSTSVSHSMDTDGPGAADGETMPEHKLDEPTPAQTLANGNEEMQVENHSNGEKIDSQVQGNDQSSSTEPNGSKNEENSSNMEE